TDTEPEGAAGAFVERREGLRSVVLVGHQPDGHRRRADAGHRADVVVLVAGLELDLAALDQPLGLGAVRSPALEDRRGEQRAAAVRAAPGLRGKHAIRLIERLGAGIDGDDAALVAHGGEQLVICGEAMSPPFVAADPFGAGAGAVVTNVADVRAMAGRPLALVDMLVSPAAAHAEQVLDGLAWAAGLLGGPGVGGHVTLGHPPALSASCTGVTRRPLRASAAAPGDVLLAA